MTQTAAIWFVVLAALLAANLPFFHQRVLLLGPVPPQGKKLSWHLLELVFWYFLVGGLALWLEQRVGQIAPQAWEFYAVTATLFITLAFPGFVFRYLWHYRRTAEPLIE